MRRYLLPIVWAVAPMMGCQSASQGGGGRLFDNRPVEEWTILCQDFTGPEHRNNCEAFAATLSRTAGIRSAEVRCVHDDDAAVSRLYYGKYERRVDTKNNERTAPPQLASDMQLLQDLGDDMGRRYFVQARMTLAPPPDVDGPAEWELSQAEGEYSLQIAVFYPEPGFSESRKAAVELVRELRSQGYSAYYYHGAVKSMVTVGVFGTDAIVQKSDGSFEDSAAVNAYRRRDSRFQYNYENGQVISKIVDGQKLESPSFLVKIPNKNSRERLE